MFLPLTTGDALRRRPILIGVLIAMCVLVFLAPESHSHPRVTDVIDAVGPSRPEVRGAFTSFDKPWTLFTYVFVHGGWSHLLGNMFFLWTFGRLIEARWGRMLTALCFFVCGAAGATLHALAHPSSTLPLVGASGAIAGLAGAVVVALPNARFNRIFSPLLWPVTPIVALVRGRGFAALLELIPFYGWILRLHRGLPAYFLLPAWLSLDLFSMMMTPGERVSYACHVGGALAGIGFAMVVRSTHLTERIDALFGAFGVAAEQDVSRASDPALAPALRARRDAERPSQFPTGRFAAGWFIVSLVAAGGLMVGMSYASERLGQLNAARQAARLREELLATPGLADAPLDARYESELFSVSYPSSFWACGAGRSAAGPCAKIKQPPRQSVNVTFVDLLRPDAGESIELAAIRGGIDKRSEIVAALTNDIASRASTEHESWTLVETHAGTCRGAYSIESVLEIGQGDHRLHMWSCSFSINRDVYVFLYVLPDSLRERDQATFERIFSGLTLPAERAPLAITVASAAPPSSTSIFSEGANADEGRCRPDQVSYRVGGSVRCRDAVEPAQPPPRPPVSPRRRP